MTRLQFCKDGHDITGDFFAGLDATEVRAWEEDGTCLGAVTLMAVDDGKWHASASDVTDWVSCEADAYDGWQAALAALLSVDGNHGKIPDHEWGR